MGATSQPLLEISIYCIRYITLFNILRFALLSYLCLLQMTWEASMTHCNGWEECCDTLIPLPRMTIRFIWRRDGCKQFQAWNLILFNISVVLYDLCLAISTSMLSYCYSYFLFSKHYEACLHLFFLLFSPRYLHHFYDYTESFQLLGVYFSNCSGMTDISSGWL